MKCSKCNGDIRVVDSVHTPDNETIRKRKCKKCGYIFYTVEEEAPVTDELMEKYHKYYRYYY